MKAVKAVSLTVLFLAVAFFGVRSFSGSGDAPNPGADADESEAFIPSRVPWMTPVNFPPGRITS